uniref:Flavonol sulfotransferase-like n=1 Tax=Flaveria bidentis TaxID=4224 RepID=FSTL_FLABI|nr:RecName: Full=Flavonol sulfotransferase-like [Flaveria bidentis]AAA87399.1 sulfotransferase-like flavonol [Flaveria bidentis]
MEEILKTLPQHTCSWLKHKIIMYKYQDFWTSKQLLEGTLMAQQSFKAEPSDVFLCSAPKTGTTWLKALAFAIVTRENFDESTSPLLKKLVHECVPFLERQVEEIEHNRESSSLPLVATHLPYASLPESVIASNCRMVYIYRNIKDVIVSNYHFLREAFKLSMEDAPFEETFEDFYNGNSSYGPYWDHILGYRKASLDMPDKILFLKYEDLKSEPISNVKRLAEFIGYPFSNDEEKAGVIENIINMCSFENLSSLEVNKTRKPKGGMLENRLYYRKGQDGDWKNYFTNEMKEKIDKIMDEKLSGTGLILK